MDANDVWEFICKIFKFVFIIIAGLIGAIFMGLINSLLKNPF
jgi:hypothetical protein